MMSDQPNNTSHTPNTPESTGNRVEPVELLHQILQRLHRMEGGLSQHEEWLRRLEQETGSVLAEASHLQSDLQPNTDSQPNESSSPSPCQADHSVHSVSPLMAVELEECRKQLVELQDQLQQFKHQAQGKDKKIAELQSAHDVVSSRLSAMTVSMARHAMAGEAGRRWPRLATLAIVLFVLAGLVSAALMRHLYEGRRQIQEYWANGTIVWPGATGEMVERWEETARSHGVQMAYDKTSGTLELDAKAENASLAVKKVDEVIRQIVNTTAKPMSVITIAPASQPEGRRLIDRVALTRQELASASQPAAETASMVELASVAELADRYKALQADRQQAQEALAEVARHIETGRSTTTSPAKISANQIAQAEAVNQQLQNDQEALKEREEQLVGRLRICLDAAAVKFQASHKEIEDASAGLDKLLKEEHPQEIAKHLNTIVEALKTWQKALGDIEPRWNEQRKNLESSNDVDGLAMLAVLQGTAKTFVTDTTAARAAMMQAIEAIGQGQDQTTKRLVLRNKLLKDLNAVIIAQDSTTTAARTAMLSDNIELRAIVERLELLRHQVQTLRAQITDNLRQEQSSRLQRDRETTVTHAKQQQLTLNQKIAQLDEELIRLGEKGMQIVATIGNQTNAWQSRSIKQGQQVADLEQLLKFYEQYAKQIRSNETSTVPIPAVLLARPLPRSSIDGRPALGKVAMVAAAPVVSAALLWSIVAMVAAARRSKETIDEYARSLKSPARAGISPASSNVANTANVGNNAHTEARKASDPADRDKKRDKK